MAGYGSNGDGGDFSEPQAHDFSLHRGESGGEGHREGGLRTVTSRWAAFAVLGMMGVVGYHQAGQRSAFYTATDGEICFPSPHVHYQLKFYTYIRPLARTSLADNKPIPKSRIQACS